MGGNCPLLQPKWRYTSVCNGLIFTGIYNTSLLGLNVDPIQIYVNGVGALVPVVWSSDHIKQVVTGTYFDSCPIKPRFQPSNQACTSNFTM